MNAPQLVRRDVATSAGTIPLWSLPDAFASTTKPMVLVIAGVFAAIEDLISLPQAVGLLADVCIMRMPGAASPSLTLPASTPGLEAVSRAVEELLHASLPSRPVVVMGVSVGALVAMNLRAPNLRRLVLVEPTLVSGKLWPVFAPLREALATAPHEGFAELASWAFGVDGEALLDRDHSALIEGLHIPTDVILGEVPLLPQRELKRFPSLVDAPERSRLAASPRVRLHIAPGAGHNVVAQALPSVSEVLREACRRASATSLFDPARLDEPLLEATPWTARRVGYLGPDGETFATALKLVDPKCEVVTLSEARDAAGPFDAIAVAARPSDDQLAGLAAALKTGGHLIARWPEPERDACAVLAGAGLALRGPVDDAGTAVLRAQKLEPGQSPKPELVVQTIIYASLLMDVRTRLPTRALRSDPELKVSYLMAPAPFPPFSFDRPKVAVLQRPAQLKVEVWRPLLATAILCGWLIVMEYDDHPWLINEVQGRPSPPGHMERFGLVHAVQTSAPTLVEAFKPYNPEVVMFANGALDLPPFPQGDRAPRVFYGAVIRGTYAVQVASSLGPAIERCPEAEFVVIGDREVFAALPTRRKEFRDYMTYEAYLELMRSCSISLSPIAPLPLRDTKSDAKFVEGSRSGVLTIASPTIYDRVIEHGVNGLLAREVADWAPLLGDALTDHALRNRLARRAWDYVRDERMFADQIAQRRDWYRDLWSRRAELNEALMARVPGLRELVAKG